MARIPRKAVPLIAAAVLAGTPPPALAGGCCGPIVAAVKAGSAAIVASVERAGLAITRQMAVNLVGERAAMDAQTSAVIAAIQGQTAALATQEAQRQFGQASNASSSAPSACDHARIAAATARAREQARARRAALATALDAANNPDGNDTETSAGGMASLVAQAGSPEASHVFSAGWMDPDGDGVLSVIEARELATIIKNATNPLPPRPAGSTDEPYGAEYEAQRWLYTQRIRAAQAVLQRQAALHEAVVDTPEGRPMSKMQVLSRVVRRTVANDAWLRALDAETTMAGVLREIAVLLAEGYRLDLHQLHAAQDTASMLALLVAAGQEESARGLRDMRGRLDVARNDEHE